jgi:hypothetical protein
MNLLTDYPLLVLAIVFLVLWLSARIGSSFLRRQRNLEEAVREDFGVILAATLTLLGLIMGFSFSMAIIGMINANFMRRPRPTRLAQNTFGLICCQSPMRRECVRC